MEFGTLLGTVGQQVGVSGCGKTRAKCRLEVFNVIIVGHIKFKNISTAHCADNPEPRDLRKSQTSWVAGQDNVSEILAV
jgi:hypothetical protein